MHTQILMYYTYIVMYLYYANFPRKSGLVQLSVWILHVPVNWSPYC